MQYQNARNELQSPPEGWSFLNLFSEAVVLVATAVVLAMLIGG
jgi:hypothetical protein